MYRFLSKLNTLDRLQAFPIPIPSLKEGGATKFGLINYEEKMDVVSSSPLFDGVSVLKAPSFQSHHVGMCLQFNQGRETKDLPDIWGCFCRLFVSEKVKSIIEAHDDLEHGFIEIHWLDYNGEALNLDQKYYWFNQRRWLMIDKLNYTASSEDLGFFPLTNIEDFIGRILDDHSLYNFLDQFPIWQVKPAEVDNSSMQMNYRSLLFFNDALFDSFQKAGVKGIDVFSEDLGFSEGSIFKI